MAGPFSPIQQADIATPRLQQTEQVQDYTGLGNAVLGVAGAVQSYRKGEKRKDLEGQIDSVIEGVRLFREGDADDVSMLEDAAKAGNASARLKLEEYRAVQRAVAQGRLPSDAATMRLRAITKAAINEAPEFADEFRAAARNALGFSPEAEAARLALREPTAGGKTAAQKQQEELDAQIRMVQFVSPGLSYEQATSVVQQRIATELDAKFAENQMKIGDLSDRNIQRFANNTAANIMTDTLGQVAMQIKQNGGIYDINAAQTLLASTVQQARAQALAGVTDSAAANQINATFDNTQTNLNNLLTMASKREQAGQFIDTMAKLQAANFAVTHPELQAWMALPNAETLFDVLNMSQRLAANPKLAQAFGMGAQAEGMSAGVQMYEGLPVEFRNSMLRMLRGEAPTGQQDAALRAYGSQQLLAEPTVSKEVKQTALSDIIENSGEYTAITALDDAKVMRQIIADPNLMGQAANLLSTKIEAQAAKLRTIKDSVKGASVELQGDKLVIKGGPQELKGSGALGGSFADFNNLRTTVEQMNRMTEVNNRYAKASPKVNAYSIGEALSEPKPADFSMEAPATPLGRAPAGVEDGAYKLPDGRTVRVEGGVVYGQ